MSISFLEYLRAEYPGCDTEEISRSNNQVYRVMTPDRWLVAKLVTDADIPLDYLARTNAILGRSLAVQRIERLLLRERGDGFDALIAEYVEGRDLADALLGGDGVAIGPGRLAAYFDDLIEACASLPRLHAGFGLYKRTAPVFGDHRAFLEHYARRYWERVRSFYRGTRVVQAMDDWLVGGLASVLSSDTSTFSVVAVDVNLKNFLLQSDGEVVLLNVPIVGFSSPAHAVGAICAHLRNRPLHSLFRARATGRLGRGAVGCVPHFEIWTLLGILSFYAVREPDRWREWRDWGAQVPLFEDFQNLVEEQL